MSPSPTSDQSWKPLTVAALDEMRKLDDPTAAAIVTARARFIDKQHDLTFAEMGCIASYVEERALWKHVLTPSGQTCRSQNEWIEVACPKSRSTWFDAKRRWKELEDVPAEDKLHMSRGNLIVMQKLSTAVRQDPKVLEAAKRLPEAAFVEAIQEAHPDQHVEQLKGVHVKAEASAAKVIEEAIDLAMRLGAHTRAEALEELAANYINDHRDEYDAMFQDEATA